MALNFRHEEILAVAKESGKVTVEGLAEKFGVTQQTIRRDLGELCDQGHLNRVHGGAVLPTGVINLAYEERRAMARQEKEDLARDCAENIPNGICLFMNIGTTTEAVARNLTNHRDLVVITNNLNVANILSGTQNNEIIIAGGILRRADGGVVGDVAAEFIRQFRADYAVVGVAAIGGDGTLLDYDYREVAVSRAIIHNARETFLVADSIKFRRHAPFKFGHITEASHFYTDAPPPQPVADLYREAGGRLHIPM